TPAATAMLLAVIAVVLLLLPPAMPFEDLLCDGSTYAPYSTFQASLDLVAAALPGNASSMPSGFATAEAGTPPNRAYAMALCRGDVNASTCAACVAAAFRAAGAQDNCPNNTGATMYEDVCVLRFSTVQFLDFLRADQWQPGELTYGRTLSSSLFSNYPGVSECQVGTGSMVQRRRHVHPHRGGRPRIGRGGQLDDRQEVLRHGGAGLRAQDLRARAVPPGDDAVAVPELPWDPPRANNAHAQHQAPMDHGFCGLVQPEVQRAAVLRGSVDAAAPGATTASSRKKKSAEGISAGIGCSVVFLFLLSVFAFVRFKRRTTKQSEDDHPFKKIVGAQCMIFDLSALQEATENFSEKNKLGEGGFGIVYKGILADGQEIAVKKLLGGTGSGLHQLHNEVQLLAELQHKNLVRLQGFCSHRDDTLLVYEYIKNGTLDNFLFETNEENTLSWEQQYNIVLGIAKGILYLHEDSSMRIIHRDLKPNNILVDDGMDPKIADFGLARLLGDGHTHTKTARAVGTLGYMAPEYAIHGRVSPKIDIFSFGVLVLEIVTRRRNSSSDDRDEVNLISDVWNCWTKGTVSQMIDRSLDEHARSQALRCIHIGLMCVQSDPDDRPYISSVIFMLTRDNTEIQAPAQPAFFFGREAALTS
uniref:Uncharacterized protein n=1 Tax=Aegilops tauschii subsp. strangulata TaxID=200361 RepID=A0A453BCI4_AEGTS